VSTVSISLAEKQANIIYTKDDNFNASYFVSHLSELGFPTSLVHDCPVTQCSQTTLSVEGMHCCSCTSKIERSVGELPAVSSVKVSLTPNHAVIQHSSDITALELSSFVTELGFSASVESESTAFKDLSEIKFRVEGMHCCSCSGKIEVCLSTFHSCLFDFPS
jgi:copper chaperone CopZ